MQRLEHRGPFAHRLFIIQSVTSVDQQPGAVVPDRRMTAVFGKQRAGFDRSVLAVTT
jgi:hypothetical protein